ncbi:MAG: hypothetical protein AAFP86_17725 [Planctomycetota bacterium]
MSEEQTTTPAAALDIIVTEASTAFADVAHELLGDRRELAQEDVDTMVDVLTEVSQRLAERVQRDTLALVVLQGVQANPAALVQVGGNPPTEQVDETPPPPDGRPFQQNADGSVSFKPPGA